MYISDTTAHAKLPQQLLKSDAQAIRKDLETRNGNDGVERTDKLQANSFAGPAVALELSEGAREVIRNSDSRLQRDAVADLGLSDEAQDALKKVNSAPNNPVQVDIDNPLAELPPPSILELEELDSFPGIQPKISTDPVEQQVDTDPPEPVASPVSGAKDAAGRTLSTEESKAVGELKRRDASVRSHEMAHAATGGALAGSPTYTYQTGPDGNRYAVGGQVSIDTSSGNNPEETAAKAAQIRAAALAPVDPSSADQAVAARANAMAASAQAEMRSEQNADQTLGTQASDSATPLVGLDGRPVSTEVLFPGTSDFEIGSAAENNAQSFISSLNPNQRISSFGSVAESGASVQAQFSQSQSAGQESRVLASPEERVEPTVSIQQSESAPSADEAVTDNMMLSSGI